jgi:RhoGEF domain
MNFNRKFSSCRLRLADILVRPMQRLTKYNLLLSAIRKHIVEENEAEIMDAMVSEPRRGARSSFSSALGVHAESHIAFMVARPAPTSLLAPLSVSICKRKERERSEELQLVRF